MNRELIIKVTNILKNYKICSICIGRLFYHPSFKNLIKFGKALKIEALKNLKEPVKSDRPCYLCNNTFIKFKKEIPSLISKIQAYEFDSIYTSIKVPKKLILHEDEIRVRFQISSGESIKQTFNRLFSNYIAKKLGKIAKSKDYHLMISFDAEKNQIELIPQNIYIYGRYIKSKKGLSQTRSYCYVCYGKGCSECDYTGYDKAPSVEGYILPHFTSAFQAQNSIFHAAGREDIDVLTLNEGRPFIVEVVRPIKRKVNLSELEKVVNTNSDGAVFVKNLIEVNRDAVKKMTVFTRYDEKTYVLLVEFEKEIGDDILFKIEKELTNRVIVQRTPTRVLHRRKDKYRYKMIYDVKAKKIDNNKAELHIRCQGGLYIKELAHGDNGRTNPNIAQIANTNVKVLSLNIISIAPDLEKKLEIIH